MGSRGFNPTMVRLLPRKDEKFASFSFLFQSHNGAIAAVFCVGTGTHSGWFQSHNGAIAALSFYRHQNLKFLVSIPQWCDCCSLKFLHQVVDCLCFNPTMVRLLLRAFNEASIAPRWFQSHNGAIAALITNPYTMKAKAVSIPQWCDCC